MPDERWYEVTQEQRLTVRAKRRLRASSEDEAYERAAGSAPEFASAVAAGADGGSIETLERVVTRTEVAEEPEPEERWYIVTTRDKETWRSRFRVLASSAEAARLRVEDGAYDSEHQLSNDYESTDSHAVVDVAIDPDQTTS